MKKSEKKVAENFNGWGGFFFFVCLDIADQTDEITIGFVGS
jgi:hypothetical protein